MFASKQLDKFSIFGTSAQTSATLQQSGHVFLKGLSAYLSSPAPVV